ncbi:cytochrome P450 [Actinomadura sp. NBRC 104425]|uniref:cytochrome P450 n=1 Tax=Actinomadura sp. NBRC 104425 TaxID=3032204 RepID=UPI0024A5EAC0|nr:cytochrome P450 [Actinomadura sp. NBRC 104425]GLZ15365.1 cytochrome P450 [Actinomadura sp. NBRC 104425]
MSEASAAEREYDPWSPEFVADPYPVYARLRAERPVFYHEPTDQWVVTRHADVDALLRDRRLGRSYLHVATHEEFGREPEPEFLKPFWDLIRAGMLDVEPPVHTRLRRLVSKAFTARMVEGLRPMIRGLAEELAGALAAEGGGDLLAEVAEPLPVTVIAEMLGVPASDRGLLRPWSADICGMYELNPSPEAQRTAVRAAVEFSDYLRGLARRRRAAPRDDLISALAQVVDEGDRLTEDELVGTCVLLLNAGHEATVNATGNAWWALFRNPGELERLRADHSLVPSAVEELLRYDTPAPMFERWVLEDIQVAGVDIPRGAEVALQFASANRDEAVFPEPDRLDLGRAPNPHITFGLGIHYCLGAPLGRIELAESFGALLRLAPRMRLVDEPEWKPGFVLRGLRALNVEI